MKDIEKKLLVDIDDYGQITVKKGTSLIDILKIINEYEKKKFICARINNEIKHLNYKIYENCNIKFLSKKSKDGLRIYSRTLSYIFVKACKDLYKDCRVSIEHSLSKGLYVEVHKDKNITKKDVRDIKNRMKEIVDKDFPITRKSIETVEADKIFKKQKMYDKLRLSKYRQKQYIHIYELDGFYDKFYGYLTVSTGYIKEFDIKFYHPGIILQYPNKESNYQIPKFEKQDKLAKIFRESERWGQILSLEDVNSLNDAIINGDINDIIRVSEALHEKKIAYIADKICDNENIRIILIAGPSSSGKTTFAQRLSIQLRVNGKRPLSVSLDDYFVNRDKTPRDENGDYDFESIEAIDIKLFNRDLISLINGEEVELPKFNFLTGKREYKGEKIRIDKEHPIIVEGIHGLNEKLTSSIPHNNKFKIYVSALTQLNIDLHNRIHTTDNRLIRRIVRDNKYRGNTAVNTLKLWDSVRRGEENNIFPFQEEADAMFNSALIYELAVLKKYVDPLLKSIDNTSKYYSESKRLLKFLSYFKEIEDEYVIPNTSIIKEFIGGSCFRDN